MLIGGLDGRIARRKIVSDGGTQGISFFIHARGAALHGSGCAELERAEDRVHGVTADIAKSAGAEIPPTPPDEREVNRIVRSLRRGSEPEIPIEGRGHRRSIFGPADALRPIFIEETTGRTVGPDMRSRDIADDAGPNQFAEMSGIAGRLTLVTHLSGDFGFACCPGDLPGFPDGVGERFFAVNMFAMFEGGHRGEGMMMIRSGDDDAIDFLHLIQHFAVVGKLFGFGVFFEDVRAVVFIDVTKGDDVFAFEVGEIGSALAADTDAGKVEFTICAGGSVQTNYAGAQNHNGSTGQGGGAEELASIQVITRGGGFWFCFHCGKRKVSKT